MLADPPPGLDAEVGLDGVRVKIRGHRLKISEWSVELVERGLFGGERTVIPLEALQSVFVGPSDRDESWFAMVLRTREETHVVGSGEREERLNWVLAAIQEAEDTRARREGVVGREYLFDKVVPDEVKEILGR